MKVKSGLQIYYFMIKENMQLNIKAILFDLVGVLVFKKEEYISTTLDEINASKIEKLFNHIDDQKLLDDIKTQLNLTDEEIKTALPCIPSKFELYPPLWTKLPKLKKKYRIAVVNNGNAIALDHWNSQFDFNIFDLFVNSGLEGVRKPEAEIFIRTCQRLKVKPGECLFMDDSLENIESARKLGMQVIWWNKEDRKEVNMQKFNNFLLTLN